ARLLTPIRAAHLLRDGGSGNGPAPLSSERRECCCLFPSKHAHLPPSPAAAQARCFGKKLIVRSQASLAAASWYRAVSIWVGGTPSAVMHGVGASRGSRIGSFLKKVALHPGSRGTQRQWAPRARTPVHGLDGYPSAAPP